MLPVTKCFFKRISRNIFSMSSFIQKLNPMTGANDWILQNEDYDFHQEVARASFADMLHDTERNVLYEKALLIAINKMHSKGKKAKVLDIGTGTGLLSMMAARGGADKVVACEAFEPMSNCAKTIIKENGFENIIQLISRRSTDLTVGEYGDLQERCNILVTEVFDTELIGEGALSTFKHAHDVLLEKDCIVVPNSATIYAQIVESPLVNNWNRLKNLYDSDGDILIEIPKEILSCSGSSAVHDIQLSQLPQNTINTLVSPKPVMKFDWSGKTPFIYTRSNISNLVVEKTGKAQAVFMWWDLQMDQENKILLSCAPCWSHPLSKNNPSCVIPWRDHWMQAIYYFPQEVNVEKGEEINLISCHDEYSLWFNISKSLKLTDNHYSTPVCDCGLHIAFSRTRIGQMNDNQRNKNYLALLKKYINNDSCILTLGNGFHLSLASIKMGAKKLIFIEPNHLARGVLEEFINYNKLKNVIVINSLEAVTNYETELQEVNLVLTEPSFSSSILPWDNLRFVYLLKEIKQYLPETVNIFPKKAVIRAVAVQFDDLFKIRCPLVTCENFKMQCFDNIIEESSKVSDDLIEAQPLWEYPCTAVSDEKDLLNLDLINFPNESVQINGVFDIKSKFSCNGIAFWVDWILDETTGHKITTGPIQQYEVGSKIYWDMHTRQGVCLFQAKNTNQIQWSFHFNVREGNIKFAHC